MEFNFFRDNSIKGRARRVYDSVAEKVSLKERAMRKERETFLDGGVKGVKTYFRVVKVEESIYRDKYLIFYTSNKVVEAPFFNRKQKEEILIKARHGSFKGYIQEVEKEGKKYRAIKQLERCPLLSEKQVQQAIGSGLAIKI